MPTFPLLALARTTGSPVLEENTATFLWQGASPVALIDDTHGWEAGPQLMVPAAPGLWTITLQLPTDAYVEYAFQDPASGERILDPMNPQHVWNGLDGDNNYFYMPDAAQSDLVEVARGTPRGTLTRFQVGTGEFAAGRRRGVTLYQPPGRSPLPLLVVLDGPEYLRRGRLNVIVDNLIATGLIHPFAMAFVQGGGAARTIEYSCSEATLAFLFHCVIPLAQEQLQLVPPGGAPYGILGASLGGSMAVFAGLRMPHVFGKVLSQSGAFRQPEGESVVMDLVRNLPPPEVDFWLNAGCFDDQLEENRELAALMDRRGFRRSYREFSGGHNYTCWRNEIGRGLVRLFGSLTSRP